MRLFVFLRVLGLSSSIKLDSSFVRSAMSSSVTRVNGTCMNSAGVTMNAQGAPIGLR